MPNSRLVLALCAAGVLCAYGMAPVAAGETRAMGHHPA